MQRHPIVRVNHPVDMVEKELPLRDEIGGALETRSHGFDVLAHTDVDHAGVVQYGDALHTLVALGFGLADLMIIPDTPPSVHVPVEISDSVEVKHPLLLEAELLNAAVNLLKLLVGLPLNRALFLARVFQPRTKRERVSHRVLDHC